MLPRSGLLRPASDQHRKGKKEKTADNYSKTSRAGQKCRGLWPIDPMASSPFLAIAQMTRKEGEDSARRRAAGGAARQVGNITA